MVNKSMKEVYENNHKKAKEVVVNANSQVDLIVNKQFELMNKIVNDFGYHTKNDRKLLLNTMILAQIDEWYEGDFERDANEDLEFDFEMIDMLHFIIQTGFLIIIEHENTSFNNKNVIKAFKEEVLYNFDSINEFMNHKILSSKYYYQPYGNPSSTKIFFEDIIHSFQYLLENVHWKTWKRYPKYTEQEIENIFNYLSALFFSALHAIYTFKDDMSVDEFANYVTELYVIKNIENFDRQERGY